MISADPLSQFVYQFISSLTDNVNVYARKEFNHYLATLPVSINDLYSTLAATLIPESVSEWSKEADS